MQEKKKIGVLFDMDGVIVDSLHHHVEATRIFAERHGFSISGTEIKEKYFGRRNQDWMPELFGKDLSKEKIQAYADEKEAIFREIYEKDIKPVAGLIEFLEDLKTHKAPVAVGSSAPGENIDFVLDKLNIRSYFDALLDDSYVNKGKPEPEIYIKAAKALEMEPQNCVVIEDAPAGIEAGKRAGAKVIGMTVTHGRDRLPETDMTVDDFRELDYQKLTALFNHSKSDR